MIIEKEWQSSSTGYMCRVIASDMGFRFGYVGMNNNSVYFGKDYSEEHDILKNTPELYFEVHGGITFSGEHKDSSLWWFGYDCGHAGDGRDLSLITNPRVLSIYQKYPDEGDPIRTLDFCIIQCEKLAEQMKQHDPYYLRKEKLKKLLA